MNNDQTKSVKLIDVFLLRNSSRRDHVVKWCGSLNKSITLVIFLLVFSVSLLLLGWVDLGKYSDGVFRRGRKYFGRTTVTATNQFPLTCTSWEKSRKCPRNYPSTYQPARTDSPSGPTCPEYFRWIHEDLKHWKETGITREILGRAGEKADFRLVILDGKVYLEKYRNSFQTRDLFTLWGILQLLRVYPGKLPDLELVFECGDRPVIGAKDYKGPNATAPPIFGYCSDQWTLDIVFPDWSFWGWAEINIKPWRNMLKDINEGNKRIKWEDRVPLAYWKGNPHVDRGRRDLMKCNVSKRHNWNTLVYAQDWIKEIKEGYKESNLADQCTHRYKIYIEGRAWSVSDKYILACDSPTLIVTPQYHDFFLRGLVPQKHYWPITAKDKCRSLKHAVDWGNNHTDKAKAIGKDGSDFTQEEMKMEFIYDYMFHLLNEYAKLLRFRPTIPSKATELCPEKMACSADGKIREFMDMSLEKSPSDSLPCALPPPFDRPELKAFLDKKDRLMREVEGWEDEYWKRKN